ncbi:molybdopterin-dependent oxidoreductase [Bradyrhizobium sp. CCGUVB23]|uniref:molybdopterin-dependent oxidoreductase n=1 Tax=Bradyrhizobium sp. CCGUVB23 TaxID=2949630 RepID=UPI0020B43E5C|nr:molybdopterin-dependent oxidoreductase [Bradyrhizobium sp. CCGUVB23]MCP3465778.1 molybdopterin-dependent oxidoreductase [Bradyrhizobium sp. CCGUVB23]
MAQRVPGYCTLCRSRCGSSMVIENGRLIGVEPLSGHPTGGALCAKGRAAPEMVHSPRRLTKPLRRTAPRDAADPGWTEISWDEALGEIAQKLGDIRKTSGAEAVAFALTTPSGTPMVDSFEWVERFIRCFGSPNLVYAIEICGWHKDFAHALTFGRGIGVPDYERADAIVLWGHNPARTWLAQATRVADARRRGARVAVVDPKPNGSGQQADIWLRIRPGADGALAMGAIRHLITTRSFDADFVTRWTNGPLLIDTETGRFVRASELWADQANDNFVALDRSGAARAVDTRVAAFDPGSCELDAWVTLTAQDGRTIVAATAFSLLTAEAAPYTVARVAELTWLDESKITAFYELFESCPRLAYHSWTGVGQHTNATMTERAIATLYALTGACDRRGGNVWPAPPPTRTVNDYTLLPPEQQAKALGLSELPLGPPSRGWITARDFSRAVLTGEPYRVEALMSFGTNFVVSQGHSSRNREALRALDFHVHVDMFMNPTAENADIVLPANMPWERDALKIGFEITQEAVETIQFRPQMLPRFGACKADYEIVAELAVRLGLADEFFGGDIQAGWNYQLAPLGVTVEELRRHPEGLRFPQLLRHEKYALPQQDGTVAGFATATRRVEIYSELMLEHGYAPLPGHIEPAESPLAERADSRFPLVLTTAKSGWFVHTSHRHVASLRKKTPDPALEISPTLAAERGLTDGDWVIVTTSAGEVRLRVRLNEALDDRVTVAEFGWWEDCPPLGRAAIQAAGSPTSNINDALSDATRDPVSGSVPLRATSCDIRKDEAASRGHWTGKRGFAVAAIRREADDVVALELAPRDGGAIPAFRPGQHVLLSLPGFDAARAYSLTGHDDRNVLSIAVKKRRSDDSGFAGQAVHISDRIHRLAVGDEVQIESPKGIFTPPLQGRRPLIFLAAGIGITPFISHLEALARQRPAERVARVLLLHGCRNGGEHAFARRLRELADLLPELELVTAYSAPRAQDRCPADYDYAGRLDLSAIDPLLPLSPLTYLCGSPDFTTSMATRLIERGVPSFDIFTEAFASPPNVPRTLKPQTVHIADGDRSFTWTPELGTLLDAAQAAGLSLPSGCRVGQCESCLMRVVDGNVARLDGDHSATDQCLTCQSVPLSELTLAL